MPNTFIRSISATRSIILTILFLAIGQHVCCAAEVSFPSLDNKLRLSAYWFVAAATEKRPAIITLHGCDGVFDDKGRLGAGAIREGGYFNAEKIHLLVLDSFSARGIKRICETPNRNRTIDEEDRRTDVFAAIRWLSQQPEVDPTRIAIIGRSHGAQTVLSVMDRTDKFVRAQPIQPRAAIALYPGCGAFNNMWNYEISAPLLLMSGELDNWTLASECEKLHERVSRGQKDADFRFHVFPGSYHAFDSSSPVHIMHDIGNLKDGTATVGGNPEAREGSHRMTFEFIAEQFKQPLLLSHEQRLHLDTHRFVVPADTGFAKIDDVAAVPVKPEGHARFAHYLELPEPKAFVITEKGGWYFASESVNVMSSAFEPCAKLKLKCWLYAVDKTVVWSKNPDERVSVEQLQSR
ncbi:MAG: Dienelactone hydrolase [Rhodocyclales bacterium]|nr:Dienelactone hydrolase [Rhodocyclales bacterium]MDB5887804.1 Dienelactone hydrolase [Rhodocyclales bacterium]